MGQKKLQVCCQNVVKEKNKGTESGMTRVEVALTITGLAKGYS